MIADMGGPSIGAVGFAIGMEATILAMENVLNKKTQSVHEEINEPAPTVYIVSIDKEIKKHCFYLLNLLRKSGISADLDYEGRSPKAQMRIANKLGVKYVLVLGPDELERGNVKVKIMETGEEVIVRQDEILNWFLQKL